MTWRWAELLQLLEVLTTGSHVGSEALGGVCHRLVDVFHASSSQMVCKATFNSSVVFGFGCSLW